MKRILLLTAAVAALTIGTIGAQAPVAPEHDHGQTSGAAAPHACCSAHRDAMAPNDSALKALVAKMNDASGDAKLALMADAINALATAPHSCPMMGHAAH